MQGEKQLTSVVIPPMQLLVGAIDSSYDEQDEVKKAKKKGLLGGLFK